MISNEDSSKNIQSFEEVFINNQNKDLFLKKRSRINKQDNLLNA